MGKLAGKAEEPWEVRPSAHYSMGGIRVNENGVSVGGKKEGEINKGILGLFAAGQAMGGLFGANRLGSTSLTELAVFGTRAGSAASKLARSSKLDIKDESFTLLIKEIKKLFGQKGNISATSLKVKLQKSCWENIGPVRTKEGLDKIEKLLQEIKNQLSDISIPSYGVWNQAFLDFIELRNMLDTAKTVSMAAMERNGSLGGHVRLDCKNISILSQPYSTLINKDPSHKWQIKRVERDRTPIKSIISYKIIEYKRLFQAKILALTPRAMRDRKLEKIYKKIMGNSGKAPEVMPGAVEGAVGESTQV
jgi:succinate dehydrogenase/fumarate reductase flavoprotein subunit